MSKVLASLKPYYYYLVGEGIKKIEVRKGEPKAKNWDKDVLFYMSKDKKSFAKIPKELQEKYRKHFGKVGLEFICDEIYNFVQFGAGIMFADENLNQLEPQLARDMTCLTDNEIENYLGNKDGYGLHISNLKIYDKPKELGEFKLWCDRAAELDMMVGDGKLIYGDFTKDRCLTCMRSRPVGRDYGGNGISIEINCNRQIERPPQSWCYVEI